MPNVISFHYVLKDTDGNLIDSSEGGSPVTFLEGSGQIIEGLEERLAGTEEGARIAILVPAAKAYGDRDPSMIRVVKRSQLPPGEINPGDRFQTDQDVHAPIVTVLEVKEDDVRLDANHPLAGVDLSFDIEIASIRPATPEEISHGHVHGPDGCR